MIFHSNDGPHHGTTEPERRPPALRNAGPGWAVLAVAVLLSGCAGGPLSGRSASGGATVPAGTGGPAVQAADPVAAFAATATPGAEGQVVLADGGRPARVRLLRSYQAGSGRECREVLVGSGLEERAALACRDGETWVATRPLLRGSWFGPR